MTEQERNYETSVILMADDDVDDRDMLRDALARIGPGRRLMAVSDGEELLDYLLRKGAWSDPESSPSPDLILLDLNMPRLGGREALALIKREPSIRHIPVVVLTTSAGDEDILQSYRLGANSFISKPVTFRAMVEVMGAIEHYWFETVALPVTLSRSGGGQ